MKTHTKAITAAALALLATGATAGTVRASSGSTDTPITGAALQHAERVALDTVGSGHITSTEAGDEESYYQVEVTKDDGTQTDVNLDKAFKVVKVKTEPAD